MQLQDLQQISPNEKKWYAIYTRSRAEKQVYKQLLNNGIEAYLPLQKVMRQWSDRKKKVEEPLFRSYVFVHIDKKEYHHAINVLGAVCYVTFEGKPVSIPEYQINNLKLLIDHAADIKVSSKRFKKGETLEIQNGSMKGLRGELIQYSKKNRLVIRMEGIQQNLLINLPEFYLEKVRY